MVVWLCGFGCPKKKSWGFVLSVTNFEVKKKERKNFPAPHVLKRGGSEASPPRNYATNIVKKFCDQKKKPDLVVFLPLLLLLGGFFFFFSISSNGVGLSLDSLLKISFFFFSSN